MASFSCAFSVGVPTREVVAKEDEYAIAEDPTRSGMFDSNSTERRSVQHVDDGRRSGGGGRAAGYNIVLWL
jgi:hypothetical protein